VLFADLFITQGGGSAEIYDPNQGRFVEGGLWHYGDWLHDTSTLLPSGQVLFAGGDGVAAGHGDTYAAGLYDPATGNLKITGHLLEARSSHTATLLPNGKVLITGGMSKNFPLSSSELYDPATGRFTASGDLLEARYNHSATLLPNGKVLIAGGTGSGANGSLDLTSLELYDPANGKFSSVGRMISGRHHHTATLLSNGTVLIVGSGNTAELYEPFTGNK
jgi:WD40 repeat protein